MKEPIRILHVVQRMEAAGTQALLMNIYRKIDRTKVQFDFLVEYASKQFYDDEIISLGGRIYYTTVREDFNIFKFMKTMEKILKEHPEYKIVHVHPYTIGYFCLKVAKKCDIPVRIAHSHENNAVRDTKYLLKLGMQKMYTLHATDLFACSEEAGKYLFKNKKFEVLQNAIDSSRFIANLDNRAKVRKELNIENNFVVGHIGRFNPAKNHSFLLEVFSELKKIYNNAKLLLIGSGELEKDIHKKVVNLSLENDVIFLGNRKDVEYLYQAMDVFIFPSLFEGLGIVAIEAQAAGVPIVCSEGVPLDTEVTPLYKRLSLEKSPKVWAEEALAISKHSQCHTNTQQYIMDSGFDMNTTAVMMQEWYLDKNRRGIG